MSNQGQSYNNDIFLFELIKNGNKNAFKKIFDTYYNELFLLSLKYLHSKNVAEDIVQEVFLKLWDKRKTITITNSLASYLKKATINQSINNLRSSYARSIEFPENLPQVENDQKGINVQIKLKSEIRKAVYGLPERCKIIFILSKNFNYSYKEIAELLGISTNTVENQMVTAFKKIRKYLKDYYIIILPALGTLF